MQLAALVKDPQHVCARYRLTAFQAELEAAGHALDYTPWHGNWRSTLAARGRLRAADAVVVQRSLPIAPHWHLLRRFSPTLIFDFDDAVFCRDSYARQGTDCSYKLRRFRRVAGSCDAVVAGNSFLAEEAARTAKPERVHVVPTCVDVDKYTRARHERTDRPRLVWVGSSSTLQGLETVRRHFLEIGRAVPDARLKTICDRAFLESGLPTDFVPWNATREAADLADGEIGISWIPDDPWSRGKCGLKLLQYMAAGLPVVTNPVGVHAEIVEHGTTGFLATSADEWISAIRTLAADPELRRSMGEAGRRKVEACYSTRRGAQLWTKLLDGLGAKSSLQLERAA
jgi:glycosyltransferase involved in cell wall biosynthesis